MARPLRIAIEDGWYHVINRGIERRSIFRSPVDSGHFLQLLAQLPTRFGLMVNCYVLMPNHYHLLVQTPQGSREFRAKMLELAKGEQAHRQALQKRVTRLPR